MSNNVMWSLWNPVACKIIRLPHLVLKDGVCDDISHCCLSSPPGNPRSILLLTRAAKPTYVLSARPYKRYVKQLKRIPGYGSLTHSLSCCDGKVFALNNDGCIVEFVIHVDLVVTDREVVIKLMLFGPIPFSETEYSLNHSFLKGSGSILCSITVAYDDEIMKTLALVYLHICTLDKTSIKWEELEGLKDWDMYNVMLEGLEEEYVTNALDKTTEKWEETLDLINAIFFVDLVRDHSVFYSPVIASELGVYIHIRGGTGKMVLYVKDKTISISSVHS